MFKTVYLKTKKESRRTTSDRLRSVKIHGDDTAEMVNKCLEEHEKKGFKLVSITPLSSASSSNVGTGGWGFSYTDGVMIVFKKKK
ncbi:hypothetical protein KMW28_04015 [Flammeovirga yaeyamensis]|uniref:DUF4177 domain-containing protein n=1 Tax=Flammeovirga yaeyamensis TaxID=367791 RepID=A0AAX1N635_9BACT|nr:MULTISPECIES: hypothetical protein [Flammeovirga]ANQ49817.1 hypothetical protein MY04_2445 [Flammeovirga sp. MY04]MBB3697321.1 fatty acid-binding protein DegV [Flammeovirga yaeyamensis]NMF36015.1 hypothetical protein [Flammeovirga yaeyamensis]QWG02751.1 hypothetical protein KMW28_04015 [Flammeovirga yaeyamensis]